MSLLVQLEAVSKSYGQHCIFSELNLAIESSRHLLLTGPSGCGKSTLLRLLAGLDAPDGGTIQIAGVEVSANRKILVPPHRRGVALVFQDLGLWPNLTALENVVLGMDGLTMGKIQKRERALAALSKCGIDSHAYARPNRLSGGEQQRLALARALAVQPRLLLLDEPFSGLDVILRQSLLQTLCELSQQNAITVLLVGHLLTDAVPLNATLAVLENGVICESGALSTLLAKPQSQTVRAWQQMENRP